jgi:hypothetical protein
MLTLNVVHRRRRAVFGLQAKTVAYSVQLLEYLSSRNTPILILLA